MNKRIAMFPGSFDPVTKGHENLIRRASALFDEVIVAVMVNPDKKGAFSYEKRVEMLKKVCEGMENVRVIHSEGLTAVTAREWGACVLVRGVRNASDLETENAMAQINGSLVPGLETVYLPAEADKSMISSSYVRQLAAFGADVSAYVPEAVLEEIQAVFKQ